MIVRSYPRLPYILCVLSTNALLACSASDGIGSVFTSGAGGSGGADSASATTGTNSAATGGTGDDTGLGLPDGGFGGSSQSGGGPFCKEEAQLVYTVDSENNLYKFDPPALTFTLIGKLDCPSFAQPFSMAVDRDANAWVVFTNGSLFKVDTQTAACTSTTFAPNQHGFTTFGMGFSSNAAGSTEETLYVSSSKISGSSVGLAKIDTQTLTLTPIGKYDKVTARAEMTGTGDAKLFGAFEGEPYVVSEVDPSNAKILSQAPQSEINYPPNSSNFAFAFWGGDFWLFVGPGEKTDVFQYKPKTGTTTKVKDVPFAVVGAGVSTCAPTKPPA